jgi:hypothetical protein
LVWPHDRWRSFGSVLVCVIGAILSFLPRTRWFGALAIMAAVLIVGSSVASFKILDAFGQVLYKHEQMVQIGPDVKHELVIFFKPDTTHDQIENFWAEVLSYPTQSGHWTRPGIGGILRLFPVQGYEAVAVTFFPSATQAEREDIKSRVHASPIVYKVMEDVVPQNIKRSISDGDIQQSLAADGAIACFSSNLIPSA